MTYAAPTLVLNLFIHPGNTLTQHQGKGSLKNQARIPVNPTSL